ncbi:MAG: anthranilate phosphoribosyltransferase [Chitinivibrionales bacterium]|nr:anthranilate phosphoribosyltransferase [Chitinivibrionales bacterium]
MQALPTSTGGPPVEIREAIRKAVSGKNLTVDETTEVFTRIMEGEATDAQIAALIVALRLKGETVDEVTGAATAMREKAEPVVPEYTDYLVDTCGTGGDQSNTFNISTAAAFVAAAAGARVAKHGNRSVSSRSGSADVLEALGVNIGISPADMKTCLDEIGICFLFAPALHKAMKFAAGPRKEIGVRTVFNILGPLTNPAGARNQVLGVYSYELTELMGSVLKNLGSERAFVVHGLDPLDEVSLSSETRVTELCDGALKTYTVTPRTFGLEEASLDAIRGGTAEENATIVRGVLEGKPGPCRDIVLLNAGFAIAAAGLAETPAGGIDLAAKAIDSGAAADKLRRLAELTAE